MINYNDAINQLFSEKEKLIIVGLTGRTGAGCSTAANISAKSRDGVLLLKLKVVV